MLETVIRRVASVLVIVCFSGSLIGQTINSTPKETKVLTLDDCLSIALENNIGLRRSKNTALAARSNDFQAIMNFLPSVNAFANYRFSSGSSFDTNSGTFFTGNFENSAPGIQAEWTVFNGLNNYYNKKATAKTLEASASQILAQQQQVQSAILGSYLAVVLDKENIKITDERIKLLEAQMERSERRYSVGVENLEQVYNFKSQLANERLNKVNLQNQLMSDRLTLSQALQQDELGNFDVAPFDFASELDLMAREDFIDVLNKSLGYSPDIKSAEASAESAIYAMKSTRSNFIPSVSLVGYYGTQFSSLNTDADNNQLPIRDQYQNLTAKSFNIQLFVPLFNNLQARNGVQVAKINMENAKLDMRQTEMNVTNTVQQVYLDLVSAQETYKASEENLNALTQTYEFIKTRYEAGNTDFYTYLESLNNKNRAELQLVNAKYSIVFRKKILDVYRGML